MASLISAYLDELRSTLGERADVDDVLDEIEDHLRSSVDVFIRSGASRDEAERTALERFGSSELVARTFAEEAKRGGAVSTTFTRRAGLAAMLAPPVVTAGTLSAAAANSTQPGSGIGVLGVVAGAALFVFALVGLRVRHGGLGALGRAAFWLAVLALPIALPFSWAGLVVLAVELGIVLLLYGIAMLRAAVLPPVAVSLFAFTWPAWAPAAWIITAAGEDANRFAPAPVLVTFGALMWLGRALWREPGLDARTSNGPLTAA